MFDPVDRFLEAAHYVVEHARSSPITRKPPLGTPRGRRSYFFFLELSVCKYLFLIESTRSTWLLAWRDRYSSPNGIREVSSELPVDYQRRSFRQTRWMLVASHASPLAQESPLPLIEMANFMGLECSYDQAFRAWKAHENASPHGDYTTHGLPVRTIEYMNATMARLLPPSLALRYGVTPTDL